jgi:hypothetical protein
MLHVPLVCVQLATLGSPVVMSDIQFSNVSCCYKAYCNDQGSLTATYGLGNGAMGVLTYSWELSLLLLALGLLIL